MRDFETIRRSLARRSGLYSHKSSFPYISGDTFRSFCKFKFDVLADLDSLKKIYGYKGKVFVAAGISDEFFRRIEFRPAGGLLGIDLLIHNGDHIPSFETFAKWRSEFSSISAVNWLYELDGVRALPIGLENWSYMRNGVPNDFKFSTKFEKSIYLLVCFNDHTNPLERSAARTAAMQMDGVYVADSSISPRNYRDLVSKSTYVLSPPGNGPDCHRTWESIYLGSIPVVKSSHWAFSGFGLPVVELADWSALQTLPNIKLESQVWTQENLRNTFLKGYEDEQ